MRPFITSEKWQAESSSSSTSALRNLHTELLDRLAKTLVSLGRAKKQLTCAIESGDAAQYESSFFEVERLRKVCSDIRSELQWRHAQYQLAESF